MISRQPKNITDTIVIATADPIAIVPTTISAIPIRRNHVECARTSSSPVAVVFCAVIATPMTLNESPAAIVPQLRQILILGRGTVQLYFGTTSRQIVLQEEHRWRKLVAPTWRKPVATLSVPRRFAGRRLRSGR